MSLPSKPPLPFTLAERAWQRQELGVHFGAGPPIADGLLLRSWKSGPEQGKPKLPPAAQSMLDRGPIEIRPARIGSAAFLTAAGLAALRPLVLDPRAMDPKPVRTSARAAGPDRRRVARAGALRFRIGRKGPPRCRLRYRAFQVGRPKAPLLAGFWKSSPARPSPLFPSAHTWPHLQTVVYARFMRL